MKSKGRKIDQTVIGKLQCACMIVEKGNEEREGTERLLQERNKGKGVEDAEKGKEKQCVHLLIFSYGIYLFAE